MSKPQVFEWHKRFKGGFKEVQDDPRSERPSTATTDENIIREKSRLTVQMIEELGLNRESVRTVLLHDLGCEKCVPNWYTRFYWKTRGSTESIFVKACWRRQGMIWTFFTKSSQEMKRGSSNTILK